jgi:hypothetical protein
MRWAGGGSRIVTAGLPGPSVCLGVFFYCSGGCLCQRFQGPGVVYN